MNICTSILIPVRRLQLCLLLHLPDLEFGSILLQHALIVVFPELLARILSRNALQNLCATWVFVDEFTDVVHGVVDYDEHVLLLVVFCNFGFCVGFVRHGGCASDCKIVGQLLVRSGV